MNERINSLKSRIEALLAYKRDCERQQIKSPLDHVSRKIAQKDMLVFSKYVEAIALGTDGGIDVTINGRPLRLVKSAAN